MPVLQTHDLGAGYGDIRVIQGLDLQVSEGELVALVGANGAGKTTLLRTIAGLIRAQAGEIRLQGERIDNLMPHQIVGRGFIMVPEGKQLFNQMTVEENLVVGSFNPRAARERPRLLQRVYELFPRLRDRGSQAAGSLSGGEQQMLAVARALMAKPSILALDEPSLGLAPLLVDHLFGTIKEIRETGLTMLLIEQNVQQALDMGDRAYVIENGRITMEGAGRDLLEDEHLKTTYMGI
jgi:branched-chain amino acid transport system ATP-binding protein